MELVTAHHATMTIRPSNCKRSSVKKLQAQTTMISFVTKFPCCLGPECQSKPDRYSRHVPVLGLSPIRHNPDLLKLQ